MSFHNMNSLSQTMSRLRDQGIKEEYMIRNENLINQQTKRQFTPEEVTIKKQYRFEGESNPSDMSILYLLETNTGEEGVLINNYGAERDDSVSNFIKRAEWKKSKTL